MLKETFGQYQSVFSRVSYRRARNQKRYSTGILRYAWFYCCICVSSIISSFRFERRVNGSKCPSCDFCYAEATRTIPNLLGNSMISAFFIIWMFTMCPLMKSVERAVLGRPRNVCSSSKSLWWWEYFAEIASGAHSFLFISKRWCMCKLPAMHFTVQLQDATWQWWIQGETVWGNFPPKPLWRPLEWLTFAINEPLFGAHGSRIRFGNTL